MGAAAGRGKARSAGYAGPSGHWRGAWFSSRAAQSRVNSFQRAVVHRGNGCPGRVVAEGLVNVVALTAEILELAAEPHQGQPGGRQVNPERHADIKIVAVREA